MKIFNEDVTFLGIDPGVSKTAIVFLKYNKGQREDDNPYGMSAHMLRLKSTKEKPFVAASKAVARMPALDRIKVTAAAVEGQCVVYTTKSTKAQPQSICDLSLVTGSLLGYLGLFLTPNKTLFSPVPRKWKGSVPKHINQARTLSKLGLKYSIMGGQKQYCVPDNWNEFSLGKVTKSEWYDLSDAAGLAVFAKDQYLITRGK